MSIINSPITSYPNTFIPVSPHMFYELEIDYLTQALQNYGNTFGATPFHLNMEEQINHCFARIEHYVRQQKENNL